MTIKILGSGCPNCLRLAENAKKAAESEGIAADIVKVTDFADIASYGIMSTPGLVVEGKVVSVGKVLSPQEIASHLKAAMPKLSL